MKKQIIGLTLAASMLASTIAFAADREISVALDGNKLTFDVAPQIIDSRTMVPIRAIFEAMGAEVIWDAATNTAICTKEDTTVTMTLDSKTQTINGKSIEMDIAPIIKNDRTLAPARYVAESFGYSVKWEDNVKRVVISSPEYTNSSEYVNVTESINQILDLIDKKMYLEANSLCDSTKNNYYLSPADIALVNELMQLSTDKYNTYTSNLKTLSEISSEVNQIQLYINKGQYLEAIELCNNTRQKYTLTDEAANRIEELAQTATSNYNNYSAKLVKSKDDAASIVKAHVTKEFAGFTDPYTKFDVSDAGTHYKVVASYDGNFAVGYQTYYVNKNNRNKITVGVASKNDACEIVEIYVVDTYGGHNFDGFCAYDCGSYYRVVGENWGTSGTLMGFGIWRVSKYNRDDIAEGTSVDIAEQNKIFKQEYGIDTSTWYMD